MAIATKLTQIGYKSREIDLYPEWLKRYRDVKGRLPADPRSSFRAVGRAIIRRLKCNRVNNPPPRFPE